MHEQLALHDRKTTLKQDSVLFMQQLLEKLNTNICNRAAVIADEESKMRADATTTYEIEPRHIIAAAHDLNLEELIDWEFLQETQEKEKENVGISSWFLK